MNIHRLAVASMIGIMLFSGIEWLVGAGAHRQADGFAFCVAIWYLMLTFAAVGDRRP